MRTWLCLVALLAADAVQAQPAENPYDLSQTVGTPEAQLAEMVELYDSICLKTFPDDKAVEQKLLARGATPMTEAMVKTHLHDDPGIGWILQGKTARFRVTIELPAYHACTVRTTIRDDFTDMVPYRRAVEEHEQSWDSVKKIRTLDGVTGTIRSILTGETTRLPDGAVETLMVVSGRVEDPVSRKVNPGIEFRFVRQIVAPTHGGAI